MKNFGKRMIKMFEEFTELTEAEAKEFMKGSESQKIREYIYQNIYVNPAPLKTTVLDVGCGNGINASIYRNTDYTGIDISLELVKEAKRRNPDMHFEHMDASCMPFEDKSFDNVVAMSFMEHLPSEEIAEECFKEMARIARRNIIIAWHTPPSLHIEKTEINRIKGHFGKTIYQNRYDFKFFRKMIPKYVQGTMRVDDFENFEVWVIELK